MINFLKKFVSEGNKLLKLIKTKFIKAYFIDVVLNIKYLKCIT